MEVYTTMEMLPTVLGTSDAGMQLCACWGSSLRRSIGWAWITVLPITVYSPLV